LWHGRKIAGAAQRRTRGGLLIQGSVQPPPIGLERGPVGNDDVRNRAERFGTKWTPLEMGDTMVTLTEELRGGKYGQPSYNQKKVKIKS